MREIQQFILSISEKKSPKVESLGSQRYDIFYQNKTYITTNKTTDKKRYLIDQLLDEQIFHFLLDLAIRIFCFIKSFTRSHKNLF